MKRLGFFKFLCLFYTMTKRWNYKERSPLEDIDHLSKEINVNPILSSILLQRGIRNFDEAKHYFRPSLNDLHDPFLMKDMDKAVGRMQLAIQNQEKILVYGDYDVDGTTSVALVYDFISKIYEHVEYYIPDRYTEGYGVSLQAIDWAESQGFDLIISLDCGIKAVEKIKLAKEKGIDFIVCDHHRPGDILPPAYAVLDPKREDCSYPFKELSGCGVGFKLLQAYCMQTGMPKETLYAYLDLVAVSIASDIVPIVDENRILAYFGIEKLQSNPRPGLQALKDLAAVSGNIDISSIVFGIGPRINAAGRIDHAKYAVKLLLAENRGEAEDLAIPINKNNTLRKTVDHNITKEAIAMIEEDMVLKQAKTTMLFKHDWHKGVIGIVASRCIEKYYRPTIILTNSNGLATGSARSVVGFDVYEAIAECADLLEQYGGHKYAAGLTLKLDNLAVFKQRFEEVVCKTIQEHHLTPQIDIDEVIDLNMINSKFYNILKQMAPFGPGNMNPVFVSKDVRVASTPRLLKNEHLKLQIKQVGGNQSIDAIGFGMAPYGAMIESGMPFSVAYCIEENNYKGKKTLQLMLKDIKFDQ